MEQVSNVRERARLGSIFLVSFADETGVELEDRRKVTDGF